MGRPRAPRIQRHTANGRFAVGPTERRPDRRFAVEPTERRPDRPHNDPGRNVRTPSPPPLDRNPSPLPPDHDDDDDGANNSQRQNANEHMAANENVGDSSDNRSSDEILIDTIAGDVIVMESSDSGDCKFLCE